MVVLDTLPKLDMRTLQRAGFFDGNCQIPLYIKNIMPFCLTINDAQTLIVVETILCDLYHRSNIKIAYSKVGFGKRAFFHSMYSGKKCKILYFHQGNFKARSEVPGLSDRSGSPTQRKYAHIASDRSRIRGTDGRGPARGRNRRAMLDRLSKDEWARNKFPDIHDQVYRLDRSIIKKMLGKSSRLKTGIWSTAAAICGAEEVPFSLVDDRMDLPLIHNRVQNPVLSRAHIGNFPVIDLSTLMGFMKLRHWKTSLLNLVWQSDGRNQSCYVLVDIRRSSICGIEVGHRASSDILEPKWRAKILWTTSGRARFICPYTGGRVDSLFIRDDLLGSREALNLHYLARGDAGVLGPQMMKGKRTPNITLSRASELVAKARQEEAIRIARLKVEMGTKLLRRALNGHWPSLRAILVRMRWGEEFHGVPEIMADNERALFFQELRAAKVAANSELS